MNFISQNKINTLITACFLLAVFPATAAAQSITIEKLSNDDVKHDFVVGPGKVELEILPGEIKTVNVLVSNRMGDTRVFNLEVEDFRGSNDPEQTVVLLGNDKGPYSLKDYVSLPTKSFVLRNGERAIVPVRVAVPLDAVPGGRYGSVLVSTTSVAGEKSGSGTSAVVSRIGSLFFVRVPGDVDEVGSVKGFSIDKNLLWGNENPRKFRILYQNDGSVHLNPYGQIVVKNLFGKEVGFLEVSPWFSLPDSLRLREVEWDSPFLMGRYTAELSLNKGYENQVETSSTSFYVLPVRQLIMGFLGVLLLGLLFKVLFSRFEIKKRV